MSSPLQPHDLQQHSTGSILDIHFSDEGVSEVPTYSWGLLDFQPEEKLSGDLQNENNVEDSKLEPPSKKQKKVLKPRMRSKPKGVKKIANNSNIDGESSDKDGGSRRGPNWKEHWIVNLIHLRGKMHEKFSGMKKQGVDNWGVLHTHFVAACPDFDRSADACRKKWKKIYDEYKSDYFANSTSGNGRASKCKYYALVDGYMYDRANVLKHVHASTCDEDPNNEEDNVQDDVPETSSVPEPSSNTSSLQGKKKSDKMATQEAVAEMAEQSKELTKVIRVSEASKLTLLQGV